MITKQSDLEEVRKFLRPVVYEMQEAISKFSRMDLVESFLKNVFQNSVLLLSRHFYKTLHANYSKENTKQTLIEWIDVVLRSQ